ncbi:hypothetical protein CKM354_000634200 [Cercospora kikuchii]|uniref:Uncharacterized protein n=1 Tax=Cercospora kikuchii TaxID=84275 RepID=A0A9P3CKK8_9PEZI|nr:uncharacterized protein CKM354_000634200 [Cercospora kikuchii]GIZ43102.1 hypothetical protein CKM354_000634200 [Cercospora kikuchii]
MAPNWEEFSANVHKLEIFERILQEQDRMLRIGIEEDYIACRLMEQEAEAKKLKREDVGTKLANIEKKKAALMRGESVNVDEDDPLLGLETKRRSTSRVNDDETRDESASQHDDATQSEKEASVFSNPDDEEFDASCSENDGARRKHARRDSHMAVLQNVHEKFPTVLLIDDVWVEVTCAECGINASRRGFFKAISGFRYHHNRKHPDVTYEGFGFCKRRVVSEADVQNMKSGREPDEVPIVRKVAPRRIGH